jgi:hypothetical protein
MRLKNKEFGRCPICNEPAWLPHTCNPSFLVGTEDDEIDYYDTVYAQDAEAAACHYVEVNFSDLDYPDEIDVIVIVDYEPVKFLVQVEARPEFWAIRQD